MDKALHVPAVLPPARGTTPAGALPAGVGVWEQLADVWQAQGAEDGIHDGVQQHVTVCAAGGAAGQARGPWGGWGDKTEAAVTSAAAERAPQQPLHRPSRARAAHAARCAAQAPNPALTSGRFSTALPAPECATQPRS